MHYVELTNHIELLIYLVIYIQKTLIYINNIFVFNSQIYTDRPKFSEDFSLHLKYILTWASDQFFYVLKVKQLIAIN